MKLWQKKDKLNSLIEKFTIGRDPDFDLQLARYDVQGTVAHVKMLAEIGLLEKAELERLIPALNDIAAQIEAGEFRIEAGVEDIHSQVELLLTRRLGEVGKKIHAGRSRNDQVLVDLRLFFRAELKEITAMAQSLCEVLLEKAERNQHVLLPGYTHSQVAMVSSAGLWFAAFAESLVDDLKLLRTVARINNQNPLGSAAGYGSSFPLDREMTTRLLRFENLAYNVVHAQLGRGKTEQYIAFGLAGLGATLGKLATDSILYSNENYGFFRLPSAFTTGSSIMPHKRNPDVFELIRARCGLLQSLPGQVSLLTNNLISGYHRDFQLLKEVIFPALEQTKDCLQLTATCLGELKVNQGITEDDKYRYLFTVERVNELVLAGIPFREAYRQVGEAVENGTFRFEGEIRHVHAGSLGNLSLERIRAKLDEL